MLRLLWIAIVAVLFLFPTQARAEQTPPAPTLTAYERLLIRHKAELDRLYGELYNYAAQSRAHTTAQRKRDRQATEARIQAIFNRPQPTPTPPGPLAPGACAYRHQSYAVPGSHSDHGAPSSTSDKRLYCRPYPEYKPEPTATPHVDPPAVPRGTTVTTADGWQITVITIEWHYEEVVRQVYPHLVKYLGLLPGEQAVAVKVRAVAPQRDYSLVQQLSGLNAASRSKRLYVTSAHAIQAWHPRDLAERNLVEQEPKLIAYRRLVFNFRPGETDEGWLVFNVPSSEVEGLKLRRYNRGLEHQWWQL